MKYLLEWNDLSTDFQKPVLSKDLSIGEVGYGQKGEGSEGKRFSSPGFPGESE